MTQWLYKFRTPMLLTGIFINYLLHASNGLWVDDFWDHSAVVTELIRNPWHPKHPQLGNDLPHVFFTPYSLLVAMVAKIFHLNSVEALSLFGVFNAFLLYYGLSKYIESINVQFKSATIFYCIVLILFFWGADPWNYSGFFHYNVLNFSLPYPSSFATGIAFLALAINERYQTTGKLNYLILLTIFSAVVTLTHAVAFIFMCAGLVAGTFNTNRGQLTHLLALSMVMLLAILIALQWPYYPYWALLHGAADVYHPSNMGIYDHIFKTTWPILLAIPFISKELYQKKNRQVLGTLIILLSIYLVAWMTRKYSYGRVVSYIAILLQIMMAIKIARWDNQIHKKKQIVNIISTTIFIIVIWIGFGPLYSGIPRFLTVINSLYLSRPVLNKQTFSQYTFIENIIEPGDTVLANVNSSWIIPTFGAKVITLALPHAFVADHKNRMNDVNCFYSINSSYEKRQQIIKKYYPKYILLNKLQDKNWLNISEELTINKVGKLMYEDVTSALYKIDPNQLEDGATKTEGS